MWRLIKTDLGYKGLQIILIILILIPFEILFIIGRTKQSETSNSLIVLMIMLIAFVYMIVSYMFLNVEFHEKRLRLQVLLPISISKLSLVRLLILLIVHLIVLSLITLFLILLDLPGEVSKLYILFFINGLLLFAIFYQRLMNEVQYLSVRTRVLGFVLLYILPVIAILTSLIVVMSTDSILVIWNYFISPWAVAFYYLTALVCLLLCHLSFVNRSSYASTHKAEISLFDYIASLKRSV